MSAIKSLVQQGFNGAISASIERAINQRVHITSNSNNNIKRDVTIKNLKFKTK